MSAGQRIPSAARALSPAADEQPDAHDDGQPGSKTPPASSRARSTARQQQVRDDRNTNGSRSSHSRQSRQRKASPHQAEQVIAAVEDPGTLVQMGGQARGNRWIREAVQCFERALTLDPHCLEALSGLGFTYLDIRDYTRAFEYLDKGLQQDDGDERLMYGAAVALFELGRLDAAHSYALRLIGRDDRESQSHGHFIAGNVACRRGDFATAAHHLAQALKSGSKKPRRREEIRMLLAEAYLALDHTEQALEVFEQMLRIRWSRGIEVRAGQLYLELERIPEAKAAFTKILEKHPKDTRALTGLGRAHLRQHEYAQAIKRFGEALQHDSKDLHALEGMAEAYRGEGNLDNAVEYIEKLQAASRSPEAQAQRQHRALAQERERRNAELLRIRNIASLNVMATGIAHELRQPLSVIGLAAQNARRDLDEGHTDLLAQDLHDIEEHVAKIDRIIHLLRDMSAGSSGNLQSLRLQTVIDGALELFQRQLDHRGIEVSCHDLDFWVTGDQSALLQILVNLIGNARDALALAETKRLELWAVSTPNRVILYVRDTGTGMSREIRRQAFDPFFTTKKDEGVGVGVGLYIAYNLARKMNGTLSIKKTAPGRGTTIELSLPRPATGGA